MRWNSLYSIKSYIKSTLWFVPFVALLLYVLVARAVDIFQSIFVDMPLWPWGMSGARTVLETIVTLTLTFIVFTFGSLLVAIQVASGQLTPRIIATALLRDKVIRLTVGFFIFTLLFSVGLLGRLESTAPFFLVGIAGVLGFCCVTAFLYLIDHAARLLRPISIARRIGDMGIHVIETVYPNVVRDGDVRPATHRMLEAPTRTIPHRGTSGIVLAVNLKALIREAKRSDVVIELTQRVGNFVGSGEPIVRVYGEAATIDEDRILRNVAFGPERTIEQDATFALRIIVDIAIKALSKAINDPTTAVLAIDQLQRLLRTVGGCHLHDEQIMDGTGRLRVIFPTPNWDDFVQLAFREIRLYGAENFQVARRLRAMVNNLVEVLPESRCPALRVELDLLDRTLEKLYTLDEDLAVARVPDTQGLGGS